MSRPARSWSRILICLLAAGCTGLVALPARAAGYLVPGMGTPVAEVGDDFEDPAWQYLPNEPKGSADVDGNHRNPGGRSRNGRWYEGPDRGQPDVVKRILTPEGGLEGSEGALLIVSRYTGIPGRPKSDRQQDDLFLRMPSSIPVSRGPSVVVRVFVPEVEAFEQRFGSTFALRTTVRGIKDDEPNKTEPYWPGLFFQYNKPNGRGSKRMEAVSLVVRSRESGADYRIRPVEELGWWTLGISFTPDGRIHHYAHPGTADLTEEDHLASHYPYGFRCVKLINVFFDVFNQNDGNWSTEWVIDDPMVYAARGAAVATRPTRPMSTAPRRSR